ncbi:reverse transcriptase family protein (plasmid) [Sulfitobacter sp. W027]|uniref:reverse transcriptase family protein n=1 Tax=Sulfitobacter sp. W027 TaxID=2867025 RepID=UPI0021A77C29|nr:reverse transcriptase family protein [Sulfitobacter sp. W027]UWR35322.1 reverse transcriptase family protein [Sulfitobacter sp. W027]
MAKARKPWRKKAMKFYGIEQSPFYMLQRKRDLADLLFTSVRALEGMTDKSVPHYEYWEEEKPDGSMRPLCRPHEGLDKAQSRVAYLIACIKTPDYVHAPVPKKTYVTNAAAHRSSRSFCLMDIESFYPSCREEKVLAFFRHRMKCSLDVAVILARLCCDKGSLPQGSSSSPILSYWAYSEMWDAIFAIAEEAGNIFTLYIDDLTVSGQVVLKNTIWNIQKEIHKHGLAIKVKKTRWILDKPASVTGTIVSTEGLRLPNRQHRKLAVAKSEFSKPGGNRKKKTNVLRGRQAQAAQILNH